MSSSEQRESQLHLVSSPDAFLRGGAAMSRRARARAKRRRHPRLSPGEESYGRRSPVLGSTLICQAGKWRYRVRLRRTLGRPEGLPDIQIPRPIRERALGLEPGTNRLELGPAEALKMRLRGRSRGDLSVSSMSHWNLYVGGLRRPESAQPTAIDASSAQ